MQVTHTENQDGTLDINFKFTEEEIACLKHYLPGIQGIVDWYAKGPSENKIHKCKKRMFDEMIKKLREKNVAIPASDSELLNLILADPDYRDRQARDER